MVEHCFLIILPIPPKSSEKKALPKPFSIPDHAVSHKQKYPESSAMTTSALGITELLAKASQHGLQSPLSLTALTSFLGLNTQIIPCGRAGV